MVSRHHGITSRRGHASTTARVIFCRVSSPTSFCGPRWPSECCEAASETSTNCEPICLGSLSVFAAVRCCVLSGCLCASPDTFADSVACYAAAWSTSTCLCSSDGAVVRVACCCCLRRVCECRVGKRSFAYGLSSKGRDVGFGQG